VGGAAQTPIPFSVNPRHYAPNLQAAAQDPLSAEEMQEIARVDHNCRLIKGQVFLWKDGQSWQDHWDMSGEITPP
jgi:alcohol dehydrogenase (NADP+)